MGQRRRKQQQVEFTRTLWVPHYYSDLTVITTVGSRLPARHTFSHHGKEEEEQLHITRNPSRSIKLGERKLPNSVFAYRTSTADKPAGQEDSGEHMLSPKLLSFVPHSFSFHIFQSPVSTSTVLNLASCTFNVFARSESHKFIRSLVLGSWTESKSNQTKPSCGSDQIINISIWSEPLVPLYCNALELAVALVKV